MFAQDLTLKVYVYVVIITASLVIQHQVHEQTRPWGNFTELYSSTCKVK